MTHGVADTERELELNTFAPELIEDPYPWYAQLRAQGTLNYTLPGLPNMRAVMLSRHADVQAVLRDGRFGRIGFGQAHGSRIRSGSCSRIRPTIPACAGWW